MVQPLAIVLSDRVVVSSQLEQKLEELDYRVRLTTDPVGLHALVEEHRPLVVFADLTKDGVLESVGALAKSPDTRHVPVVGFAPEAGDDLHTRAAGRGVKMVIPDSAVLQHLKPLLDQALQVD